MATTNFQSWEISRPLFLSLSKGPGSNFFQPLAPKFSKGRGPRAGRGPKVDKLLPTNALLLQPLNIQPKLENPPYPTNFTIQIAN